MSKHGVSFYIEGAEISIDEMGQWAADIVAWHDEHTMELFQKDAAESIYQGIFRKVEMTKAQVERARVRRLWKHMHPPNFSGFYYCHICGGWVHEDVAELDHIVPSSVERIDTDVPGWDDKLRMAHALPQEHNGKVYCIGNQLKGSTRVVSKTMEIAPPDEAL